MSDQPINPANPAVCDGLDHGVTPERLEQLRAEADAFNRLLKISEPGSQGSEHDAEAQRAVADFYQFLPSQPTEAKTDEARAFEASKAFYEQLTNLPIGERRALADLAQRQNQSLVAGDDAMPILKISMNAGAFIDDLTVKYPWLRARDIVTNQMGWAREDFTFHYRGMCAASSASDYRVGQGSSFSIDGTVGLPFSRRHR
jgi:hypothetical protein